MAKKKIESIKHKDNRAHIPSMEEAGYEEDNPAVQESGGVLRLRKNPITHRGQDPELMWMNKYGKDNDEEWLDVDIRSLYRHEHIAPETLIAGLHKVIEDVPDEEQLDFFSTPNALFGNALDRDELDKVSEYYQHNDGWTNRLIQGDSHLVMASLLEREGMAGKVQCIYFDPPYGIKYKSNWQMKINDTSIKEGADESVSGEPEMIKAFRDTWEIGIHSYLSYLRERLLIAKNLLTDSGSIFMQISDDNLHLVRTVMDEVFGSENFVNMISFSKAGGGLATSSSLSTKLDYLLWFAKSKDEMKYRALFEKKTDFISSGYTQIELADGSIRSLTKAEKADHGQIPKDGRVFMSQVLTKPGPGSKYSIEVDGVTYDPGNRWWGMPKPNLQKLVDLGRAFKSGKTLRYKRYLDDFPYSNIDNLWSGFGGQPGQKYVVQTNVNIVERCMLMTSDPGDLILDPTCGSGTSAFVAEKIGRRWILIDTSRIALNIAKQRMTTAVFPYYELHDPQSKDIRQGFKYKSHQKITSASLANEEPAAEQILYDQPIQNRQKLRVSGPFTVETLQNFEPHPPKKIEKENDELAGASDFQQKVFAHLQTSGVKNGIKNEQAVFVRTEPLTDPYLHAEGFFLDSASQERKAYFHIGPKFGTVAKNAVNESIKSCRSRGDADWLIVLGFSFESNISNKSVTQSIGSFEVTKVRMHDDLMQEGLLKKDKNAGSFITIGEPDIKLHQTGMDAHVEICGLDIYDPIKDEVKARNIEDISYWMVDDDYDGNNFVVKQVFFCGGKKDEFDKWKKGLDMLAKEKTKTKVERSLRIEIDDEAFDRLYGFKSHPIKVKTGQKVAVRVISQFGEESTKVLTAK